MSELETLLEALRVARLDNDEYKAKKNQIIEDAKLRDDYRIAEVGATNSATKIAELETKIREIGLQSFQADGEKHPHPKVEVKIFPVAKLIADRKTALREWLFTNFRPALIVDEKKVIDEAKAGNIPAEFVELTTEPRVQIATKL